ncbi:hypothetical protein AYO38_04170 [bacterium SCGC AG-212-C10]|nr:hypothetical protein AYO38_04170 [bacterium SCGC AG-212-C10]
MTDPLPAGYAFVSFTGTPPTGCSAANDTVTCTRATLNPGATFLVTFTATVPVGPDGRARNVATVTSSNDKNAANNKAIEAASLP